MVSLKQFNLNHLLKTSLNLPQLELLPPFRVEFHQLKLIVFPFYHHIFLQLFLILLDYGTAVTQLALTSLVVIHDHTI
jgi:hypothetical protein